MRMAARVDANHAAIVAALRAIGAVVTDLSGNGKGVPDILVAFRGMFFLLEIKVAKGKLNELQTKWFAKHTDCRAYVVRSVEEAIAAVSKFEA